MGSLSCKQTRRLSFDNTFAISPPIAVRQSIADEPNLFDDISSESASDFSYYKENADSQDITEVDYWHQRIESLKKEHQSINSIIETEYDSKIESTNNVYRPPQVTHEKIQKIKPCFDWRAKILQCYEDNPHQPLVCSTIVQAFINCVSNCRAEE